MLKKISLLAVFVLLFIVESCKSTTPSRIVSQQSVKTEILGLKLCDKTNEDKVEKALKSAIGEFIITNIQRNQNGKTIRAIPSSFSFSYGGLSWTYVNVYLDGENSIVLIELTASYESIDNAKRQYELAVATFEQKYGKGNVNPQGQLTFWTDDVNSVGVAYQESAAIDGGDRSFCTLYYVNIALADRLDALNASDI